MKNSCSVLRREELIELIKHKPPLLEHCFNVDQQIQPNGIDLTIKEIAAFDTPGIIGINNSQRALSGTVTVPTDKSGVFDLKPGSYLVTCNEIVNLPQDIMAMAAPRSSLLRCGVSIFNAIWDAGYSGRSQSLMVVFNPGGFKIFKNSRFNQLVFFRLSGKVSQGYNGIYQGENV